jgi:hypothetical protein
VLLYDYQRSSTGGDNKIARRPEFVFPEMLPYLWEFASNSSGRYGFERIDEAAGGGYDRRIWK